MARVVDIVVRRVRMVGRSAGSFARVARVGGVVYGELSPFGLREQVAGRVGQGGRHEHVGGADAVDRDGIGNA